MASPDTGYDLIDSLPVKTSPSSVVDASADADAEYIASLYPEMFGSQNMDTAEPSGDTSRPRENAPIPEPAVRARDPVRAPKTRKTPREKSNMAKYIAFCVIAILVLAGIIYAVRKLSGNGRRALR